MIVRTERLEIVPGAAELQRVRTQVEWLNDPMVVRYSEQRHHKHTVTTQIAYILSFEDEPADFLEVRLDNRMIGTMTVFRDEPNSVADMGIMIGDRSCWGKGYGTEAWDGLMKHLFSHGVRKVEAGCMGLNLGMQAVFRRTKMEMEGRRWHHFHIEEEMFSDMLLFGKRR